MINPDSSWYLLVRKYVYELIILMIILAVIAVSFFKWYNFFSNKLQSIANDYHQATISHLLKASSELEHSLNHLRFDLIVDKTGIKRDIIDIKIKHEYSSAVSLHIIQQEIRTGLQLQQTFSDKQFKALSSKLAQQLSTFVEKGEDYFHKGRASAEMIPIMRSLITSINQMVKLHSVAHKDLLSEIKIQKNKQNKGLLILMFVLLLIGSLITFRAMKSINQIIELQQEYEQKLTEQKNKFEEQSYTDLLTTLPNRRYFYEYAKNKLAQAQRSHEKLALLYIDLDGFKAVNDKISHQAGDIVLQTIGKRCHNFARANELIARIGGDEFAMVIYDYKERHELEIVARRIIEHSTKPVVVGGIEAKFGMSIGIAIFPDNGKTLDELIFKADNALYEVKTSNKGSFAFAK